eukprot:CAMPEP_0185803976 /NCGR_PEP_ID=MMETSP1322-20130828/2988_1 /TAXON_ID=265543 /ORGANISM="Minutocellus polymorphus, Strain RCC2270" /LENGTH=220 /DNA_ID=CAMNT_0028499925 /DNA_START=62 /DNA_END=724 /DNA_ORIENTATION=+
MTKTDQKKKAAKAAKKGGSVKTRTETTAETAAVKAASKVGEEAVGRLEELLQKQSGDLEGKLDSAAAGINDKIDAAADGIKENVGAKIDDAAGRIEKAVEETRQDLLAKIDELQQDKGALIKQKNGYRKEAVILAEEKLEAKSIIERIQGFAETLHGAIESGGFDRDAYDKFVMATNIEFKAAGELFAADDEGTAKKGVFKAGKAALAGAASAFSSKMGK